MTFDEDNLDDLSAEDALRLSARLARHADEKFREVTGVPARI